MSRVRAALKGVQFFDKELLAKLDSRLGPIMNRFGATVRLRAKGRIRRPRRKRLGELTNQERIRYFTAKRDAQQFGLKAEMPFAPSAEGEFPRSHTRILPESIYYAYDPAQRTVFVGPIAFGKRPGEASGALEHGGISRGRHVAARPYMKPSFDQILATDVGKAFKNIMRR
jgi:hypothetical protein